jgi:hypothetical protein
VTGWLTGANHSHRPRMTKLGSHLDRLLLYCLLLPERKKLEIQLQQAQKMEAIDTLTPKLHKKDGR